MNQRGRYSLILTACPAILCTTCSLEAQQILSTRPELVITPPAVQEFRTNIADVFQSGQIAQADDVSSSGGVPHGGQPFTAGPFTFRPHLDYRFLYGDGIERLPGQSLSTAVHEIAPGLLIDLGTHWALDYTPTIRQYSNSHFRDSVDELVRLNGGTTYQDWTFEFSQTYSAISAPLIETGTQTDQENHITAFNATYAFAPRMSLDLGLNQNIVSSEEFSNYKEWSTLNWLNYQVNPRLDTGLGLGGGYVDVEDGVNMAYERLQGRARWRATQKLSFQASVGGEDRQFLSGGADDLVEPIYAAQVQYQPIEATQLSLSAGRNIAVSYFQDEVSKNDEVRGDWNQRLLKKLYLNVGGGYHTIKYIGSTTSNDLNRKNDYWSAEVRLTLAFLKRGTLSAFYQRLENSSSQEGYSFTSNQVGFEIGYKY